MSEKIAIHLAGVGKMYKMFPSRFDNLLDAINLTWLAPQRRQLTQEYWALRGVDLEVKAGTRLGIIGRNGAGKSTLLKLITQNKTPTEGTVAVNGQVQALLEAGAGFHPEFTGYENIRASLIYQGMELSDIQAAIADIEEFTELDQFLLQPFKSYSAGMQARLTFATATVLRPDILIVDEILGAGDAYFAGKSLERMKNLVENSGATVLIVSHALDQILQYCDECIWMERGRLVQRGPTLEIIKAYEQFIHILDERRLKAKNYKRISQRKYNSDQVESYSEKLVVRFRWEGDWDSYCDVSSVKLVKNGEVEEEIHVGDTQDTSSSHSASVILEGNDWSRPEQSEHVFFRRLTIPKKNPRLNGVSGGVLFHLYAFFQDAIYTINFDYRCRGSGKLFVEVWNNDLLLVKGEIPSDREDWTSYLLSFNSLNTTAFDPLNVSEKFITVVDTKDNENLGRTQSRWPGKGTVEIESVRLLGADGGEKTVFPVGSPLTLSLRVLAEKSIRLKIVLVAALFRIDGILITKFRSQPTDLTLSAGEMKEFRLEFDKLNYGNHNFVFSVGLFENLVDEANRLDLIDRSFEFRVIGNDDYYSQVIINLPGEWKMV